MTKSILSAKRIKLTCLNCQLLLSVLAMAVCLCGFADTAAIPDWLPEDFRFNISGTPAEIAAISNTLVQTRDAISPRVMDYLTKTDMLGACLQQLVACTQPNVVSNEDLIAYYKMTLLDQKPLTSANFDPERLTNAAVRINSLAPIVHLSLIWGVKQGAWEPCERAVPGVDYPVGAPEDDGSTSSHIRLNLTAPKNYRVFLAQASSWPYVSNDVEYKWLWPHGIYSPGARREKSNSERSNFRMITAEIERKGIFRALVFARIKGCQWGMPSMITITVDKLGKREYRDGTLAAIDYGNFKDYYVLDGKNEVIGFERRSPGVWRGEKYSLEGELIEETYSEYVPKLTRKVDYAVKDGKLTYTVQDGVIKHKDCVVLPRSIGW